MASTLTLAATPHHQFSSWTVYTSPSFPSMTSSTSPRSRTTSLFSSVSANMPHFSGRLSFGGWGGKEGSNGEGGGPKRRLSGKGKERASNDVPSKTRMPLFARHFSNPSTSPPLAPTRSGSKKTKGESSMATYQRRAGTFSFSSPELSAPTSSPFQPWPALDPHEEHGEQSVEFRVGLEQTHGHSSVAKYASRAARSFSSLVHSAQPLPPPQLIPHSPSPILDESDSDDEPISPRSALATYASPALPSFSPPPSPSPPSRSISPPDPTRRAQAHAQALAKLTEASSVPFPKRSPPPPPVRPPPPPPLEFDRARTRSSSGDSEGVREVLRGGLPARPRKPSARGRKSEEGVVGKVKEFLERELGEKGLERREGTGWYEERENVEEEALWAALRDGVVLCR